MPAAVAWSFDEGQAMVDFIMLSVLGTFMSAMVFQAIRGHERQLNRYQGFILCLLTWLILPFYASMPFVIVGGYQPVDALFEATSGLTTSGATLTQSIDALPKSLVFWRSEIQWFGGLLTLVTILFILAPGGLGGLPSRHIRLIDPRHADRESLHAVHVIRQIVAGYSLITLVCAILLYASGIDPFDAICLAFATVSTGGFMPRDGTLDVYGNTGVSLVLSVFMLMGATSLLWHRMILSRRIQLIMEHRESYLVLLLGLGLGLLFAVTFYQLAGSSLVLHPFVALAEGVTTGISIVTSTGFDARSAGMTVLPLPLLLMICFMGGTTFSAAGGLKLYRIGGMLVQSLREVERLVHPHSIRPSRFGSQPYDMQLMKAIWTAFCLSVLLVAATAAILSMVDQVPMPAALTAAISNLSLIGQIYSSGWIQAADWPSYSELSHEGKMALSALMVAGRLDVVLIFGILGQVKIPRI
ncbi:TrkH family potassium uptake protein [Coralliovum pocilloporae]|uniref:TrkH family potassium uptake protein n=1 Tax=Coralliovum pocilloporae TaxID=3066369 RepID=UPI0033074FEA